MWTDLARAGREADVIEARPRARPWPVLIYTLGINDQARWRLGQMRLPVRAATGIDAYNCEAFVRVLRARRTPNGSSRCASLR